MSGDFYDQYVRPQVEAEMHRRADRIDAQAKDLIACGYAPGELRILAFQDGRPEEVVPASMLEPGECD